MVVANDRQYLCDVPRFEGVLERRFKLRLVMLAESGLFLCTVCVHLAAGGLNACMFIPTSGYMTVNQYLHYVILEINFYTFVGILPQVLVRGGRNEARG